MVGPTPEDRPCWPPTDLEGNTYITVYQHHLEFGLHFPLHPFLHLILWEYNIFYLPDHYFRGLIGFIWCCEFLGFPLTLNLFRACFGMRRPISISGWYIFYNANGMNCSVPKIKDLKDWNGMYCFIHVPTSVEHPNRWFDPTRMTQSHMLSPKVGSSPFFSKHTRLWDGYLIKVTMPIRLVMMYWPWAIFPENLIEVSFFVWFCYFWFLYFAWNLTSCLYLQRQPLTLSTGSTLVLTINLSMTKVAPVLDPPKEHKMSTITFDEKLPRQDYGDLYFDKLTRKGRVLSSWWQGWGTLSDLCKHLLDFYICVHISHFPEFAGWCWGSR